jgi:hypothetical protein
MTEETELISLTQAARELRVTRTLLSRRVASGELAAYESPRDRRMTLVKLSDLALLDPNHTPRRKQAVSA